MRLAAKICAGVASVGLKASSGYAGGLQPAGLVRDELKDEKPDDDGEIAKAVKESESMDDVTL
jgi:hypothetical protein